MSFRIRLQELAARQSRLDVCDTVLVGRKIGFIEVLQFLRLRKKLFEFGVDNFHGLWRQGLREAVKSFAEAQELEVECWVGGINCVCS